MDTIQEIEAESETKIEVAEALDHSHDWELDVEGNGVSKSGEHVHEVIGFLALPATEDGHSHRLPLPAENDKEEWVVG